ncbi:uncharacterized protein LOC110832578 isoform X2 [Zootermopsis nevadensis]|nr:uncharacterized protein LOC110832578 isoform X2 [Zootermopsis nevadensis]
MKVMPPASNQGIQPCSSGFYRNPFQSRPEQMDTINSMCSSTMSTTVSGNQKLNSDACFGCFSRVITQAQDAEFLNDLSSCASKYLDGTAYQPCAEELAKDVAQNETEMVNINCVANSAFCSFDKCIQRVDKINLINMCIEEVQGNAVNDSGEADEAKRYIETTACILAKIRCRNYMYNPRPSRPGMAREPTVWNMYQASGLFVSADFDLRVTNLPYGSAGLTCGFGPDNVGIAAWPGATC